MNAIVIVFIPSRDAQSLTEQTARPRVIDLLPQSIDSDQPKTVLHQISDRDQTTPPFWTWFVENPRACRE